MMKILVVFLVTLFPSFSYAWTTEYNSGNHSELIEVIPIKGIGASNRNEVVYQIDLGPDLEIGDIIFANAEIQATNELGYLVSVVTQIRVNNTNFVGPSSSIPGLEITEENGPNVETTVTHHSVHTKVGTIVVTDPAYRYVSLWVRANSWSTLFRYGDAIEIDGDYGRLSVLVFSNN
ncbi:hypothetical protein [Sulfurovum sp.]|uniref:hypothetical protein n=1 Tax=Sulfurovum sp. TaxID=1969726 RepID=UPI00356A689A